ncbi:MAG: YfhO family protein [Chloroflexi bacterium]|nr:YfhO family protein [Chloroflexota bacterium]
MNLFRRIRLELERNKSDCLAVVFLAAWPLIFFWPAALRQAVFSFGDIFLFFYPTHLAFANALRAGRLPMWEPRILAGFPLYAEGQIGAFYPTHPLLYGLLPIDIATNYDILMHLAWVAVGTYILARTLNLQRPSAFLAAFAFSTGGFFFARLQHMSVLATASWLPWLMWAWEMYERERDLGKRLRWFALLAIMSAIQLLGGHPQFAFSSALLLSLYAVVRWKRGLTPYPRTPSPLSWFELQNQERGEGAGERGVRFEYFDFTRLIPLALFFAIGVAITAVQLIPTFELAGFTNRASGLESRFFNAFSLRPIHYLMLFHPFLQGDPFPQVSVEVMGYVGFLVLILAMGAPLMRRDRRVVFFTVIALVALFLGLGDQNIFYRALRHLPLFNYFRVPSRFLYWYTFAAAMLAGIAFDYLLTRAKVTAQITRGQKIAAAIFALLIAVIVGVVPSVPLNVWLSLWVWLPLVFAFVTCWIILGARRGLFTRTTLVTLVLGLTVVDLALFAAVYAKTYDSTTTVTDFYRPPDSLAALKGLSPQEGRVTTSLWIFPWQGVMRESLYPNISLIYGVPSAVGYTPLIPQRTGDYLENMTAPLFNLMNIRYLLVPQLLPVDADTEGGDVYNKFNLNPAGRDVAIPPTAAVKLKITSSTAQSVDWKIGSTVADIYLTAQGGNVIQLALRSGQDTAEWAFERSDVRRVIPYPMPTVATTYSARSAFPTEAHNGHTFLAEFDLTRGGPPPVITGLYVYPKVEEGLLYIERVMLVTPEGQEVSVARLAGRDDQTLIYRTNDVAIFENPDVLPRAFLVHDARVADDQAAEQEMLRDDFKPRQTLLLADGEPVHAGDVQRDDEQVRIVEYENERVVLSVRASAEGYVLLSDAWFPGWVARLDGVQVPIRRADLIFRAVRVGPGEHRLEFEYRPQSLYVGAAVSGAALLVVAGIWIGSRRVRRVDI